MTVREHTPCGVVPVYLLRALVASGQYRVTAHGGYLVNILYKFNHYLSLRVMNAQYA